MRSVAKLVAAAVVAGVLLFSSPAEARMHHNTAAAKQVETKADTLQVPMEAVYQSEFVAFMKEHDKEYAADEFFLRYNVFKSNFDFITKHNAEADQGVHSYRVGVNHMADMTLQEYRSLLTHKSTFGTAPTMEEWKAVRPAHWNVTELGRANYVDLRQNGQVTDVKNQQQCGGCWAFSACAAMEGAHARAGKGLISLSPQQIIDCSGSNYHDNGCNGGEIEGAFQYATDHGIGSFDSYPFTGRQGGCRGVGTAANFRGYQRLPQDENAIADAVNNNGVVSVALDASSQGFQLYKSGIFSRGDCGSQLDHAVAIVGYGWDQPSGKNFWIIKNSWATTWGAGGYIWLHRDVNMCNVHGDASYPHSN